MKNLRRATAAVVVIFATLVFILVLVRAVWGVGSGIVPPGSVAVAEAVATSSMPARLRIPSLGIDAKVQYVGVTKNGAMGVPNNFTDVAWYKNGTAPGQLGSAVIDGHVDNGLALAGVFKHLSDINVGDSLYIETNEGATLHFVVYDVEVYPYDSVPMDTVFADVHGAHLNVITCGGSWVQSHKTYDHRIVVYTTLVTS